MKGFMAFIRNVRYRRQLRRRIARAKRVLDQLDAAMALAGLNRSERRRTWRDLHAGRLTAQELIGG